MLFARPGCQLGLPSLGGSPLLRIFALALGIDGIHHSLPDLIGETSFCVMSSRLTHRACPGMGLLSPSRPGPARPGARLYKSPKAWTAYRLARVGKRLGTVYGETEKEVLQAAYKQFKVRSQTERKRIYLRIQ